MKIIEKAVEKVLSHAQQLTREELGCSLLREVIDQLKLVDNPDNVYMETEYVTSTLALPNRVIVARKYRHDLTDCWGQNLKGKEETYNVTRRMLKELGVREISADDPRVKEWIEQAKKRKWKWLDIPESLQEQIIGELEKYLELDVNDAAGYPRILAFYVLDAKKDSPNSKWNEVVKNLPSGW